MGKIIITEDEKSRILNLYEDSNITEETELVGYFNPFRHTQYLDYFRPYSPNLRSGDLYYEEIQRTSRSGQGNNLSQDCQKNLSGNLDKLNGKTFRTSDNSIHTIKDISYGFSTSPNDLYNTVRIFRLKSGSDKLNLSFRIYTDDGLFFSDNSSLPEKLISDITSQIKIPTAKDMDDCFFKLMKVNRTITDYKP